MTWKAIDDLNMSEVARMVHLILYAAVDGMDGSDAQSLQDKESGLYGYWHGCVETAARAMAFLFAGSNLASGEGIGIGDAVSVMMPDLEKAAIHLMDEPQRCPHCNQSMPKTTTTQKRLNQAERYATEAAVRFFDTFSPPTLATSIINELREQQRKREYHREKFQR